MRVVHSRLCKSPRLASMHRLKASRVAELCGTVVMNVKQVAAVTAHTYNTYSQLKSCQTTRTRMKLLWQHRQSCTSDTQSSLGNSATGGSQQMRTTLDSHADCLVLGSHAQQQQEQRAQH